jgi:hypothetical protein
MCIKVKREETPGVTGFFFPCKLSSFYVLCAQALQLPPWQVAHAWSCDVQMPCKVHTDNCFSTLAELHFGHFTVSSRRTSISKAEPQSEHLYS